MTRLFNPPHPGEILKEDVLPALGLTVTQAAEQLGVARVTLSRMINGYASISAYMAIRLSQWLVGSAESWMQAQLQYDLWHAKKTTKSRLHRLSEKLRKHKEHHRRKSWNSFRRE